VPADRVLAPEGEVSGSEALYAVLQKRADRLRQVLLLRAEQGRQWLLDRLQADGASVESLAVYVRSVHRPDGEDLDRLRRLAAGPAPLTVCTSSEAPAALIAQAEAQAGLADWMRRGVALASHPRIVQALHLAGFSRVIVGPVDADAVAAARRALSDGSLALDRSLRTLD
jgi:uroporphyrinogen-III synthase